ALQKNGRSLLTVGITQVEGLFNRGDVVDCINTQGELIARGIINYSSEECLKVRGLSSQKITEALGYIDEPELIHRNNLVIF
ncbi:MAG: PUA domain-containing protein, partial [Thiotrichaceae bacterium]